MTENDLMDELMSELQLPPLEYSDITIKRIAAKTGMSDNGVRSLMDNKVRDGLVKVVYKRGNHGNKITTYVKP